MSLSTKLAGNFTKNVRKRGDDYYCKGRVMIHEGSQSELTACVRGSGFYNAAHLNRSVDLRPPSHLRNQTLPAHPLSSAFSIFSNCSAVYCDLWHSSAW